MNHYVARRRRCWKWLKELDPEIELPGGHRADMLLDLGRRDKRKGILIKSDIGNARDFDRIAEDLIMHRPRVRIKEGAS